MTQNKIFKSNWGSFNEFIIKALGTGFTYDINHRPRKCLTQNFASEALEDEFEVNVALILAVYHLLDARMIFFVNLFLPHFCPFLNPDIENT